MHARVPQPGRRQRKESRDSLLTAEERGLARAQQIVAGAGDFAEGAQLHGEREPLQGAREPSPVESPGIPLLFLEIDVQMAKDAVESKRVVECVQIGGSSLFRNDGFYLGEDPEKGSS